MNMMNVRMTDKQRIIMLEAENATLRDEVEAWRAWDKEQKTLVGPVTLSEDVRMLTYRAALKPHNRFAGGPAVCGTLICLIDNADRWVPRETLFRATSGGKGGSEFGRVVDVHLSHLRRALAVAGAPGVIQTIKDKGVMIRKADVALIHRVLGIAQ